MPKHFYSSYKIRMEKIRLEEQAIPFDCPEKIKDFWREYILKESWYTESQEIMVVFHLNTKNKVTGHHLVSIGTLNSTLAHPRDVFRTAILNNSASIIAVHNHPSGDTTPSDADIKITRELARAGKLLKIDVLDSIIVDNEGENYRSLREMGYLYDH